MRVAICISGEFRTFKQNYKALMQNMIEPYNADVFISSWTKSSAMDIQGNKTELIIDKKEILEMYKPKGLKLYDFEENYFYELKGIKIPEALIKAKPNHFRANLPQFYLMKDCNNQKTAYEDKNKFKYDVVIRTRFDLLPFKKINLNTLDLKKIYLKHIINDTYYCDQFAISSSELIDKYTSVFDRLESYWKNPLQDGQFKNILNGETLMRHHLLSNDYPHERLWVKFPIIRFNESKLDKLKKIYINNIKNIVYIIFVKLKFKK